MTTFDSIQLSPRMQMPEPAPMATRSRVSPWLANLAYPLARYTLLPSYFHQIRITGQEHIPMDGPVILAPTHRSRWDAIMIPYATGRHVTGRDLRFMVTADEMKGLQGWLIRHLGGFAVNPKHPAISSLRHGVELLLNGEMLVIFPEGNIFRDNEVHPLKPGLARLAMQAESNHPHLGVKIVPVAIRYNPIVPRWRCEASLLMGEAMPVANYWNGSPKKDAAHLTADLEVQLKLLDQQAQKGFDNRC